jgi:exodeoxyribonuclease V gamma subunit
MFVHRSNRTERLVEVLAEVVAGPPADPFARECIVVQGKGMERWLSMKLAQRLGVWANPDFPFPRHLVERAVTAVLGDDSGASAAFEPESLMWSVEELLPAHLERKEFEPIRNYLSEDARGLKRIQLAERIADTFDHYVVYRPAMVLAWENGAEADWQAVLWRALVARHGPAHLAARAQTFLKAMAGGKTVSDGFPKRVSLFGISTLPPLYVHLLEALSRQLEMHLFALSPSREYWAEIRSKRDVIRELSRRDVTAADAEEALHLEEGNPLLASLGRVGRDFQQVLEDAAQYDEQERDLYEDPGTATMLSTLQSDILNLRRRGPGPGNVAPLPLQSEDDSITIHSCHSPMREVEVLRDRLLALFDADHSLDPHDVVVMTPDVDRYAPFVEAVFGDAGETKLRIPYDVADRNVRTTSEVLDAFERLLDLIGGRFTAPDVLDLLGIEVVRDHFQIHAEEVETLRAWVSEAGIRWGIDAEHRESVGQPALSQNTWRFGLDRLLLGYAMPGNERTLYGNVLPYDDVEGKSADLLGRVADFCATLFGFRASLQAPRLPAAWRDDLGKLLDAMIANTSRTAREHQQIRLALAAVAECARVAGYEGSVDRDAIRTQIKQSLQRGYSTRGFLCGGVTFCELVPMRTIPFRVICLMGMNDDTFPRTRRPLGFDLIARRPMTGDRSQREDDRYLFLEALLSARERLIITYVGQGIRDNMALPPSVVVSELLDALGESFCCSAPSSEDAGQPSPSFSRLSENASTVAQTMTSPFEKGGLRGISPNDPHQNPPWPPFSKGGERRSPENEQSFQRGDPLLLRHPLQSFSPRYFRPQKDSRLFSYSASCLKGAEKLVSAKREAASFVVAPIPLDAQELRVVALEELVSFFEHPTREFLRRRLDLRLEKDEAPLDDREPAELSGLERWVVGEALLARALRGEDLEAAFDAVRAAGRLPPGVPGRCIYEDLLPEIAALRTQAEASRGVLRLDALGIDGEIEGTRLTGLIRDLWNEGQVRCHYTRIKARPELGMWIRHVALNWAAPPGFPRRTSLIGRPKVGSGAALVHFRSLEDPESVLAELLRLYWLGHQSPLPLFPETSRTYAATIARADGEDARAKALEAARKTFEGSSSAKAPGERDDPDIRQVHGNEAPFDVASRSVASAPGSPVTFECIALSVFGPLLEHLEDA